MVKKTILFGSLRGSTSASLKMGEILAILKSGKFLKLGVALILCYLLTGFITYTNKIGSSANDIL